ncbi:hypothetical protein OWV82_000806 [Melia azedarach]|uniref:Uncharacterized protein n=1 Tax=Melia azedarach TaxID=155640 RepID=A0ACC1YVH0_MELAZ|nr:hypothetical protein OWV82_000806 [Melia azedarach]
MKLCSAYLVMSCWHHWSSPFCFQHGGCLNHKVLCVQVLSRSWISWALFHLVLVVAPWKCLGYCHCNCLRLQLLLSLLPSYIPSKR